MKDSKIVFLTEIVVQRGTSKPHSGNKPGYGRLPSASIQGNYIPVNQNV